MNRGAAPGEWRRRRSLRRALSDIPHQIGTTREANSAPHSVAPVQRFYKYQAAIYDLTRWTLLLGRNNAVDAMRLRTDASVLEIGCGTGLNFSPIQRRLDSTHGHIVGVDFSEHMLKRARRRVERRGWRNVDLCAADATRLDLGRQFDAVFFAYSLSMIPDWRLALERAAAHLAPGGRIVVLDFGRFEKWGPMARVMRGFLRVNHVKILDGVDSALRTHCEHVTVQHALGGHHAVWMGVRSNDV